MDVDNAVFIQRAKVHRLFSQARQLTHLDISAAN